MDSRLRVFLQLIHDVIKTNGAEYIQKESKFAIAKSTGQMSIRYKVLLKLYQAVDIFLTAKKNDGDVIEVLEYCRIDYSGKGDGKNVLFYADSLVLIDQKLSQSNDSQSLVPFVKNNGDVVVERSSSFSMPPLNRCGSIQTDEEESLLFNISSSKIDQFKGKTNYHTNSVQRVYRESGLQQVEDLANNILRDPGWNSELKQKCIEKLLINIQRQHNMDIVEEQYSDYVDICTSIKQFIAGLDATLENRSIAEYIAVACGYESGLSSRRLAKIIGINRNRFDQLKTRMKAYLNKEEEGAGEVEDHVLDEEPPPSSDEESIIDDSIDDLVEVDDEEAEIPVIGGTAQVRAKISILRALKAVAVERKERCDKVNLSFVRAWWHFDTTTQYDTNSSRKHLCYDPATKSAQYHRQRLQYKRSKEMHKDFLLSEEYIRHLELNPTKTVGLTLFKQARCNCIKWDKWRKCADTMEVQFKEYLKAQKRMCRKEKCNCTKHTNSEAWSKILESAESYLGSFLCPPKLHDEIPRTSDSLYTREKKQAIEDSNIKAVNLKIEKLGQSSRHDDRSLYKKKFKVPKNADKKAVENELLTLFHRKCCGVVDGDICGDCGIQQLKGPANCSLETNSEKIVSFKRYEKEVVHNIDGTFETKSTRMLTTVKATYKEFFETLYLFLKKYLRHYWFSKWDKFHRNLFFDGFPTTTLAMHTDFSATYETLGQDEATCHQPRTCIQQVFVVSTVHIDGQGRRTQLNESMHFWGENDSKSCPSNYVFHNTCVKAIVQLFQSKFNNRFTKLAVFSDGCAEQYKSSHAAHEMTFLRAETNINEIIHTYAPTAQFKCCCDSAGSDTKTFMRRAEKAGQVRANNTWEVFVYLHDNMPQPDPNHNRQSQFKITARNNFYVAREAELTQEMQEWRQKTDNNIVILRESVGEKKGQKLIGIRGIYQIRVNDEMDEQCVMHRNITCACSACVQSNYDACLTNATWTHKSLNTEAAQEHRNAAINQREAYLDQAAIAHEEQEASRFIAIEGSMNETWEKKRQRRVETSKKRGNLTAKLDQARIQQSQPQAAKRSKHKNP